jgi:hypothetical protein
MITYTHMLPLIAKGLIDALKEKELHNHPIFFHVMSNGGAYTYSYILRELQIQGLKVDLRGTIYDSCPTPMNLSKYFQATVNIGGDKSPV